MSHGFPESAIKGFHLDLPAGSGGIRYKCRSHSFHWVSPLCPHFPHHAHTLKGDGHAIPGDLTQVCISLEPDSSPCPSSPGSHSVVFMRGKLPFTPLQPHCSFFFILESIIFHPKTLRGATAILSCVTWSLLTNELALELEMSEVRDIYSGSQDLLSMAGSQRRTLLTPAF